MDKLDKIDIKLIEMLQTNARTPLKVLAENVFLSSPAVSSRILRLEKEGYIKGFTVQTNHEKLGYPFTAFINLELSPEQKNEFYPYIRRCSNVLECYWVTGSYSMLIKAAFSGTATMDSFIGHLQTFGKTTTQVVLSEVVEPREIRL